MDNNLLLENYVFRNFAKSRGQSIFVTEFD